MDIDKEKFEKLAIDRLPLILLEKNGQIWSNQCEVLRTAITILLLRYTQLENIRLPQYKAEKQAMELIELFDFYYEYYVIGKHPRYRRRKRDL